MFRVVLNILFLPFNLVAAFGRFLVWLTRPKSHHDRQLAAIRKHPLHTKQLMNRSEYRLYRKLERLIATDGANEYRVFPQVSMGELFRSDDPESFRAINSKRVDFAMIDREGWPIALIEYQGEGHWNATATIRDKIKAQAAKSAGVLWVEVTPQTKDSELRASLSSLFIDCP